MAHPRQVQERLIGPFDFDEATRCISNFALALTNLGLNNRFVVEWEPRRVVNRQRYEGPRDRAYYVVLLDQCPDAPYPEDLSAFQIRRAECEGYKTTERQKPQVIQYEAFGETKNLSQWARAVGVHRDTLKSRINAGKTMEAALTEIALSKAKSA